MDTDAVDALDDDAWGLVYANLVQEEDAQARKNMVLASKRFRTNPRIASQHLTRLYVYEDTTRRDLERSVPQDARITHVVVREAPRDWKLWYHDRLDDVQRVTFIAGFGCSSPRGTVATEHFTRALHNLQVLEIPFTHDDDESLEMLYHMGEWSAMPELRELRIFAPDEWAHCDYTHTDMETLSRVLHNKSPRLHTLMLTNLPESDFDFSRLSAPSSLRTLELQMVNASDVCYLRREARLLRDRLPGLRRVVIHSLYLQTDSNDVFDQTHYDERAEADERRYAELGRALAASTQDRGDEPDEEEEEGFRWELSEECFTLMGAGGHLDQNGYGPVHHARMLRAMRDAGGGGTALARARHVRLHKLELSEELASEIGRTFSSSGAQAAISLNRMTDTVWFDGVSVSAGAQGLGRVIALLGAARTKVASFGERGSQRVRQELERLQNMGVHVYDAKHATGCH